MPSSDSPAPTPPPGRVLIAICTYNEAGNVVAMLRGLRESMPDADLLVVDDGSPDGTAELAQDWSAKNGRAEVIVRHDQRGLGGAIRRAVQTAVDQGYDFFLNLDADLSHDPAELPRLLQRALQDDRPDVVVGSRYIRGGSIVGWPVRRKVLSRMVNTFAVHWLRLPVSDCSGSMRCYRVDALSRLDLDGLRNNGYALLEELLVRLRQQGAGMAEVPICFTERQVGESKLTIGEAVSSALSIVKLSRSPSS
ncbi:polyprenol monophosphomannose synthase [Crateriforma spongiae]|uniref:polyprenol monophosphomannose synthase n=1 Tax=Crateriforma spongiae TaxID=2724528 RepID=UPI001446B24E|nr:polyprenol monophosphomannose synthase [Crateriforma spongiae]